MVDAVTSQTLFDDGKYVVMKFTNLSDGSGESAVLKVDVSALDDAPTAVTIDKVKYDVSGMAVSVLWDADTDVTALVLQGGGGEICFRSVGGLHNNAGAGKTGDIRFTTTGAGATDSYTIVLYMRKN